MQDASDQVYSELPPSLRKKLGYRTSSEDKNTPGPSNISGLVPVGAHGSLGTKLANPRLPLENPAKESDLRKKQNESKKLEKQKRSIASRRRRSGRLVKQEMNREEKKALQGKGLIKGRVSYELMEPLHRLWLGYISELLNLPLRNTASAADLSRNALVDPGANGSNGLSSTMRMEENSRECLNISIKSALEDGISVSTMQGWQTKLVKADFHGARIQVKKAKHPALVGLSGIVLQETEGTFRIVTIKNAIKVIPKLNVSFSFMLPLQNERNEVEKNLHFDLYGGNFVFRSSDRATRKFKAKGTKGLDF